MGLGFVTEKYDVRRKWIFIYLITGKTGKMKYIREV